MPAEWESQYQRFLAEARLLYETDLLPSLVEALYLDYADAIERIVADFGTGRITAERADSLEQSILRRIVELGERLVGNLDSATLEAARLAAEGHRSAAAAAAEVAGVPVAARFAEVPGRALEMMIQRRGFAETFRTLVNRHIEFMADDVEAFLRQSVARGLSGRKAGQELAALMARDDPVLLEVLQNLGPRGGRTARAIRGGVEIGAEQLSQARSILFDGRRIAVTETNAAYFTADQEAAQQSDVVDLVKWEVSGRHYGLPSSPDVCTTYHERDWTGYGPGLFHPQSVPLQPHPFCQCHTSKVLREPNDWDKPKRDLPRPKMATEAETRQVLERAAKQHRGKARTITDKFVKAQTELANGLVQLSDEVAREGVLQ